MKIEQLFLKCRDDYILMTKKRPIVPAKVDERTEYLLKFLAHKNGEDHPNYFKSGEYIHGTNIKVVSGRLLFKKQQKLKSIYFLRYLIKQLENLVYRMQPVNYLPLTEHQF
jgi:hypothetical protein